MAENKKNTAFSNYVFAMVDASGDAVTGITPSVQISKDGGAFAASANAAVEISNGFYGINFTANERNAEAIGVLATGTGAKDWRDVINTVGNTQQEIKGDTAAVKARTDNLPADTAAVLDRILGLGQENYYLDNTVYSQGQLTSGRIRVYSLAASVGTASDVIASYDIAAVYSSGLLTSYKVTKQ
ncbi:MAG: hypothetical protein ACE5GM_10360 [bacterium]